MDMTEMENEWADHLLAIDIAVRNIDGFTKCHGFANAGMCFGCQRCHRGVIADTFVYVLGDGKIRVYDRNGDLENIMESLIVGTKRVEGEDKTILQNEWILSNGSALT